MKLYRAECTTYHFEFEAYGKTEKEALDALLDTLAAHAKQYSITATDWFSPDDLYAYPVETGSGLRDKSPIKL